VSKCTAISSRSSSSIASTDALLPHQQHLSPWLSAGCQLTAFFITLYDEASRTQGSSNNEGLPLLQPITADYFIKFRHRSSGSVGVCGCIGNIDGLEQLHLSLQCKILLLLAWWFPHATWLQTLKFLYHTNTVLSNAIYSKCS
jgi:hypothetical protein